MRIFFLTLYLAMFAFVQAVQAEVSNKGNVERVPPIGIYCAISLYSTMKANLEICASAPRLQKDLSKSYFWLTLVLNNSTLQDMLDTNRKVTQLLDLNERSRAMRNGAKEARELHSGFVGGNYISQYHLGKKLLSENKLDAAYYWIETAYNRSPMNDAFNLLRQIDKDLSAEEKAKITEEKKLWTPVDTPNENVYFEDGKALFQSKPNEAIKLIEKSAMAGNVDAQYYLAKSYAEGEGAVSDREFLERINDAIDKLYERSKSEKPVSQKRTEMPFSSLCSTDNTARILINHYKKLPKETFDKHLQEILDQPGPPSLSPCI